MMYEIGMEVEAWCGQCKVDRRCAISSLNADGSIDRVTCTYCQTARNYRPPEGNRIPARVTVDVEREGGPRVFSLPEDELRALVRSVVHEEIELIRTPIADKWSGGTLVLKPGKPGLQEKEIPIDVFFHKIVMLRDRLRVLEQQINSNERLSDAEKVQLQQYITRCYGSLTTFNVFFKEKADQFVGSKKSDED